MICFTLYELVGFGDGVGCWVRVIMVCYFMFDCDFLGCICLIRVLWSRECCDFERFVRFGWFTLLCWSKLWGDYCWVVVILDSWVGVVSCDSWGGFGGVSGWFAYDRDWVRCRGWGFVLVSILSAFVAYVVVDWCSGVDWLVVGGDLCFSGVEWWLCELVLCLGSVGWLSGLLLG